MCNIFDKDRKTKYPLLVAEGGKIVNSSGYIGMNVGDDIRGKGEQFADEIELRFISDFERKDPENLDKMVHVSTFCVTGGLICMTYYANTKDPAEDPNNQTARFAYAPVSDPSQKVFLDLQKTGDQIGDKTVDMVYDTILMQNSPDNIYCMWAARTSDGNYYRFYCPFNVRTKTLGEIRTNRFRVKNIENDFSVSGIKEAFAENRIPVKKMYSDIGIMQKLSMRVEKGEKWYYSGMYSGDFNCIIKSQDLITWEYVSQPDFINESKWENAVYVWNNRCYYFVRQQDGTPGGFLTYYNLNNGRWANPVIVEDCQSRGDFINYMGGLYLFHAPIDREHIGILQINTDDLNRSKEIVQAHMHTSCFYPFVQYYQNGELAMSYTVGRKHIRLSRFDFSKYI